jgi:pyruvate/2-oxoglutarate/acetoin dehydrogenase E1 component/TPP-dependent pyruvate/acetoin dehydrogenase alpha subunit
MPQKQKTAPDMSPSRKKPNGQTASEPFNLATSPLTREQILNDYRLGWESRQTSLIGRREVMGGKAKFGIFGDGKELPQLALAHAFRKGDFRSGYYRDQTLMFALGATTIQQFFAQLYAHADPQHDPASAGRQMNAHFATPTLHPDGSWRTLTEQYNTAADVSPTSSQMPRLTGLAYASKLYRHLPELAPFTQFSQHGEEIAWGIIGNASCAEGMFWETVNALGVLQCPAVISIWDDGYGISVTNDVQVTKNNVGELLKGFARVGDGPGYQLFTVRGWDYPALVKTYLEVERVTRRAHVPALIHVIEVTQPQGHSTSGSHERYKSPERLAWEEEFDGLRKMRQWMLDHHLATPEELDAIAHHARAHVETVRAQAWEAYQEPIKAEMQELGDILDEIPLPLQHRPEIETIKKDLLAKQTPIRRDLMVAAKHILLHLREEPEAVRSILLEWKNQYQTRNQTRYSSHLFSQSPEAVHHLTEVKPVFSAKSPIVQGYQIMNACFDAMLARDPRVIAFGEDVGKIGDVNQGFAGLQTKYGDLRVTDTGIREVTIIGQAIGMAMRGLRPLAEIQYLDYLLYALQILSDDLATLQWRTRGGQKAPVILRTRGHRLEGVWHAGSPMAGIIHLVRGMHVFVPRDMTRAAGFYNTLLLSDEPGLVVEVLNGYRLRERLPDNVGEFRIPAGVPEVIRTGRDITLVTYGACCRIVLEAAETLAKVGIEAEVIDVQSLLPFDIHGKIVESLQKTNRILFIDEDVPGGTTAYMMQEVLEKQNGYAWLDAEPHTLSARVHRPAYGTDGNYWSKPNAEEVFEAVYQIMHDSDPKSFPLFF